MSEEDSLEDRLLETSCMLFEATKRILELREENKKLKQILEERSSENLHLTDMVDRRSDHLERIQAVVDKQAEYEGLWFVAIETASEGYLQQELRKLHRAVEDKK